MKKFSKTNPGKKIFTKMLVLIALLIGILTHSFKRAALSWAKLQSKRAEVVENAYPAGPTSAKNEKDRSCMAGSPEDARCF